MKSIAHNKRRATKALWSRARRLLMPTIDRILVSKPALAAIQAAVSQQELRLQFLSRLTPLNRALTSYVLSAAGVGFARFTAACVGLLPYLRAPSMNQPDAARGSGRRIRETVPPVQGSR